VPDLRKESDKSVAVGVEITGSRATVALVDDHGKILHRCYAKTLWGRPAAATLEPYLRTIENVLAYAKSEGLCVRGLGVCIPGTLDQTTHRPLLIPTIFPYVIYSRRTIICLLNCMLMLMLLCWVNIILVRAKVFVACSS
jgi:hypothetical protein